MLRVMTAFLIVLGLPGLSIAQYRSCQAPAEGCQAPESCYYCPPRYPGQPEAGPPPGQPEAGAFVVPRPTGEVQGESRSMGMRFGTIHFPEITIPFPTLQLPSLVRYRRDAEMITSAVRAPFVGAEEAGQLELRPGAPEAGQPPAPGAPEAGAPPYMPTQCVPYCPPACEAPRGCTSNNVQQLEQRVAQLQSLVEQLAMLQMQQQGVPVDGVQQSNFQQPASSASVAPPRPGGADAEAQRQAELQRQADIEQQRAQYEQKCQEVDQLRTQVAEMQRQYQLMLEMQQNEVFRQREERLRSQLAEPRTQPAALVQPAAEQTQPVPGGNAAPVREEEQRASTGRSMFQRLFNPQTAFSWRNQNHDGENSDVSLSSLSR